MHSNSRFRRTSDFCQCREDNIILNFEPDYTVDDIREMIRSLAANPLSSLRSTFRDVPLHDLSCGISVLQIAARDAFRIAAQRTHERNRTVKSNLKILN